LNLIVNAVEAMQIIEKSSVSIADLDFLTIDNATVE
jgi:hypothetical protein